MYNHILFLSYWIINSLLLYFSNTLFSGAVTLGNWRFSPIESSIYGGFWVTFVVWIFWDFAIARKIELKNQFRELGYFCFANFLALLTVTQFNNFTGVTFSGYDRMLIVGIVLTIFQRLIWNFFISKS